MKMRMLFFMVVFSAALISCSEDEKKVKGDPDLTHEGVKWNIASIDYILIDQSTSGTISQVYKTGTKENAGSFYLVDGSSEGSFEMNVEGYNKEDYFTYSIQNEEVSIVNIEQNVGVQTNQNVIYLSGANNASGESMTLSGSIVKQSTSGQFMMEVEILLEKAP